jgi:hypothetical protein
MYVRPHDTGAPRRTGADQRHCRAIMGSAAIVENDPAGLVAAVNRLAYFLWIAPPAHAPQDSRDPLSSRPRVHERARAAPGLLASLELASQGIRFLQVSLRLRCGLRSQGRPQDRSWLGSRTAGLLVGLHEGHHPIRPAKRDRLVMLGDEPCPGNQRAEPPIQVRKQRLRDGIEQSTL